MTGFTDAQRGELRDAISDSRAQAARESLRRRALATCGRMAELLTDLQTHAADLDDTRFSITVAQIKPPLEAAGVRLARLNQPDRRGTT